MAYSEKQWDIVRAFYERGLSLAEIAARHEVEIKDRSSISKKAKSDGWVKGKNSTLVQDEALAKQKAVEIAGKKSTLNSTELEVHNTLVAEKIQDDIFFRKASHIISRQIIQKVQTEKLSMMELKVAQDGIGKGKENIYGRSPEVTINNTNAQQNNVADELRKLADRLPV